MVSDHYFGEAMNAWATMHEEHVAQIAALKAERDRYREAFELVIRAAESYLLTQGSPGEDEARAELCDALSVDAAKDGAK